MMSVVGGEMKQLVKGRVLQALFGLGACGVAGVLLILGGCAGGEGGGGTPPSSPPSSPSVTLTIAKAGTGAGTVSSTPAGIDCGVTCTMNVASGTVVTLTATPATGSTVTDWGGACSTASATCAVTITANRTVTVSFTATTPNPSVSSTTVGTGSGSVTCSANGGPAGPCGVYSWGEQVSIVATPAGGSSFTGWSGGVCSGTGICVVTLTGNIGVTATFVSGSATPNPVRLSASQGYTLAVRADGRVLSIGAGMTGGSGTVVAGTSARIITGLSNSTSVLAPFTGVTEPNFAIASDGSVRGWGFGILGASVTGGYGNTVDTPILVPAFGQAQALSVCNVLGMAMTYALHSDGTVSYTPAVSQIAANATRTVTTQTVAALSSVVSMSEECSSGLSNQTVVVKSDGTVWTLTPSSSVVAGPSPFITTTTYSVAVAQVTGLPSITHVSCGREREFCLARAANGTVWAWGDNADGQLGDGTVINRTIPIQVPGLASIATVIAGFSESYAIDTNGAVYSWGGEINGVVGILGRSIVGPTNSARVPGLVTLSAPAVALAASGTHAVALLNNGTLWSWGFNSRGEFGDGTSGTTSDVPVQAVGLNLN